jgi:large subunit ribosomal protein L6
MSRIGKLPVPIASGVKVAVAGQTVKMEGPKGKLEFAFHPLVAVSIDEAKKELVVTRKDDQRQSKALHGLTRSIMANMVEGVAKGYKKSLEIQGVGYKAEQKGKNIVLSVGYANTVSLTPPAGVTVQLVRTPVRRR